MSVTPGLEIEANSLAETPGRQPAYTGILPYQAIKEMVGSREIMSAQILKSIQDDQIQPASIDLRLGSHAYPVDTSFLPGRGVRVLDKMKQLDEDFEKFKIDLREGAVLERGRVYVVPLLETIKLKSEVSAFANPKSSTGRLDILTRLIADEATHFDQVENGYEGQLYIEIAPRSFSVVVRTGTRLNQLRFRRSVGVAPRQITIADWKQLLDDGLIVGAGAGAEPTRLSERPGILPFTVDLRGTDADNALIGWRAKKHT